MIELEKLLPLVCKWAYEQEERIQTYGEELTEDQKIDAYLVGIKNINRVRVLYVDEIPLPEDEALKEAGTQTGLLSRSSLGVAYQYGIFIDKKFRADRNLLIHELTHTMQYERFGSVKAFLKEYISECLTIGYENSELEMEAQNMEKKLGN